MNRAIPTNGITLHVADHPGAGTALLLLPGLTANADSFGGLVAAGLAPAHRVLAFDLRGRARSDRPTTGYTMADHAADVIGVLDHLGLERVFVAGHSFGGLLSMYLAATAPARFARIVVIDASAEMHPNVRELIAPSIARLGRSVESEEAFLAAVRAQPFWVGKWDALAADYYRAELETLADGRVHSRTSPTAIAAALDGALSEPWLEHVGRIEQPVLLINAVEGFGPPGSPPVQPADLALRTVAALRNGRYVEVPGNHLTMMFGDYGAQVARAIIEFLS